MSFMEGPGHAAFCGNDGPHEKHRHPLSDSYEVCSGRGAPPVPVTTPDMVSVIAAVLVIHYSDSAMPADLDSPDPQWIASCDCDWEGTAANHGAAEALHAAHQAAAVLAAISEAGNVEWAVSYDDGSPLQRCHTERYAKECAADNLDGGPTIVSRITTPWERAE